MPVIARSAEGKVVSLWGTALIRGADGKLRLLKVGDIVRQGDQILTTQDGIVQIENGEAPVRAADAKAPAATDDVEQAITALNRGDRDAAPAAGLAGGGDGSMQEGLRVDRIAEGVSGGAVPRSTADADLRVVTDTSSSPAAATNQGGSSLPPLDAPSSTISTAEEGAPANLGLTAPTGAAAGGTIRVDQVPTVGEIRKADGTLVTAGTALTPADLPGLSYVPPADYDGGLPPGSFTYTLTTADGRSSSGSTSITLSPVNDAPVATAGNGAGNEDAALPISLGGTDVDGRIVGVTVTALPTGGSLWLADGVTPVAIGQTLAPADAAALIYRPGADFNGSQSIQFTVTDNGGATSAPASIALTVVAVNDAPLASDDAARAVGTAPVRIDVLANDRDADGDTLTVVSASVDPALGTVTVHADGNVTFAAAPGVTGPVAVTYTVADASGATSSATLSVNVAAGPAVTVDAPALTSDATPVITGTSNLPAGSTVTVVVTDAAGVSQTLTATVTASGSFAITVPGALAEGGYTAVATASDAFGNAATASDSGTIDLTAPSLVVDVPALTNDSTPTITGTTNLPAGSAVSLVVTDAAGVTQILTVTVVTGGTFSASVPAALAEGGFTVFATAADAAGNSASANDAGAIDVTAPSITVDAPTLTNDATPTITGTTNLPAGSTVSLVVTDALGASQTMTATVAVGGTYSVDVPAALAEGSFTVVATATDAAGNSASANDAGALDITAPSITVDAPTLTNDATPTIAGTTSLPAGSTISLVVTDALGASQTITATVAAGGTYSVDVPVALAEGSFTVVATATDAAGNSASANDAGSVDVTAPSIAVDAPTLTNDATPTITGTTNLPAGSTVSLVITDALGASQTIAATVAAGGTYSVDVPAALAEGNFTVVATATDAAGNTATANDAGSIDITAPSITVDAPTLTNDATPTITGTTSLPAGSTVSLLVTDAVGASQTITATVATGGTYSVDVPAALAEGSFTVVATATDATGNSANANDAGALDITAPSITVDAPALTNDATPTIAGTTSVPAGSSISLVVTDALGSSQTITATVAAGGTYSVDVPAALAEGSFTVVATATDAAGNSANANDAGAVDVTAPSITVDAPALTNDSTPTITGTTNLPTGSTISLFVTDALGASQTIAATVAAGGTYSVDVPAALAEGNFTVVATATDAAGNSATANDAGSVDVTAPSLTVDAPALTNDSTPTITGTTNLPAGSTVSLVVTDALGAAQTIAATVAAGGSYSVDVPAALAEGSFTVVATATDAAGNSANANDAGAVDVTAPSITVDAPALTNDSTPTITGTTNLPAGSTISLVVTDALGASQTIAATVVAGGTYSVNVPGALAEGSFTVVATATDAAGNSASANDAGAIDVTAPSITVDAPALTNDDTPTITGTTNLPAGSTVSLLVTDALGAAQTITATVAAGGTYSVAVPTALAEGNFTVVATATDAAGNSANANDAGAVDVTAPSITVDAPALTNDSTPTITGTTSLPSGSTISLVVTDALGASQTLTATVAAGGTYSVDVPIALAEGSFTVIATATDAAGNSASANDAGAVDVTAPSITVDAPALTNDSTPTITGTANLPAGATVSLVVTDALGASQTVTATIAAGGTYSVDVPAALAEGSFTVVATATDAAGNSASANDVGSIDVTAPSVTVDVPALTNDSTPTITGTASLPAGSTVSLVVTDALGASQTITATVNAGGTYSVDVPTALPEGSFNVVATATDTAGNSANATDAGAIDVTAPSITVDAPTLTNDATPTITGTTSLPAGSSISLVVTDALGASQTITATVAAGGTYSVDVPAALAEGSFTVVATATDAAGNSANANDAGAVDVTAPSITVDAPALTNDSTPTITGTTNLPTGSTISLFVTDALGASQTIAATVAAGGTYSVDVPAALAEGNFTVVATATDAAGNSANANDAGSVDLTAPSITVDAPTLTNDATPIITGTTSLPAGSSISLVVTDALGASQTITATVAAGGSYSVDVPAALAEGNFTVVATATDAAGNTANANDAGSVDTTAPSITVDAPALTNDATPTITGTTNLPAGSTIGLVVTDALGASQTITATVAAGGTYSVDVPAALAEGSFTVVATATDAAGNSASANDAGAVDLTAPSITVDAPALTNDATPTITGTTNLPAGSTIGLVVTDALGASQTITATVAAGGTYSVDVPAALAEGNFTVVATATDAAGNTANANDAGSVDTTAPSITVDAPALTNDATPTITGTTNLPAGSTIGLVVTDALGASQTITATVAAGGTYSVDVPAALAEGSFTVVATATDAAGNSASANDAGAVDLTAPSITVDAPALTNDATPTITGTTNLPAGSTIGLVVTDALGASQTITATVAAGGTYSVDVPAALAEGNFTVVATATDAAGNSASANDSGAVDVTAPSITVDVPSLTNDATPTITGTTNLPAGSAISLVVTDALGASQTISATVAAGGTYSVDVPAALAEGSFTVAATATDAAGNSASANDSGAVDVTAPSITVDAPSLTNDATPTITGTTSLPAGSTVTLVVTDALGASQTIAATIAAGGTYSVSVPAALAEGGFTVVATATDAAGNSANANDAGSVDTTAPSITVDAPALTNDSTPIITGTTNLPAGSTVSLVVTDSLGASQTLTATVAAGSSYSVEVPTALAEGNFTVVATATDAAGNSANANDVGTVDVTAPSITVDAPALTNDSTPTITGTTNLPAGSTVSLVITDALGASQTITATVAVGGSYSVEVPTALAEGNFTVVATATDAAGNSANANDAGSVDVTAPSITVDAPALTNDSAPTITGTTNLPVGSTVSLVVTDALGASQTITATVAAGGTYSVNVPAALAEGAFTVVATATDAAGNSASANDAGALDITAPSITVDVPSLTNDSTPTITGTTDLPAGSTVSLVVTDALGASQTITATVAAGGTYSVAVPAALAEGNFTAVATATDTAGNSASANDAGAVDVTAPSITVDAPALTNDSTPTITGTTNLPADSTVSLVVTDALGASQTITATVAAGGTYSVDVPTALAEGNFTVVATATDAAGNSASANDAGSTDTSAPSITVDAPALTNDATPTITGTANLPAGSTISLVVTDALGATQALAATVTAGGTYSVAVPTALPEGNFAVVATATDAAGNSASANDAGSVDITAPSITVDAPALTNDSTPTITGTTNLPIGSTVSLLVTDALGASQTIAATVAAGGTYSAAVPAALAEGSFTVVATATDAAGNSASANDAGSVDVTAPTVTVDAPALTNDSTPTITGTTNLPAGSTVSLVVTDALGASQTVTATVAAGGTYSVNVPAALAEGGFTVAATATDAAGNSASANDAGSVDITAPSITVDAPALTNDSTPTITGTTNLPVGSTVSLLVTDALGASQTLAATVAAGGTYSAAVPAALAEGSFTVVATAADAAGNSASASDAGSLDVTAPIGTLTLSPVTADNVLSGAEAGGNVVVSGVAGGDAVAGDSVVLTINGQNYLATVGAGGSFSVAVPGSALAADADTRIDASITLTDAAGNSSTVTATQSYAVNTPPAGADRTVVTAEDGAYQFTAADFGYTDADGQPLAAVRIDSLPGAGQLLLGGVAVVAGQQISAADLANLRFVPAPDANGAGYASFSFSVGDGLDFDTAPNQLTIDVTPVNDAPVAQPAALTVAEDAAVVGSAVTAVDIDAGTTLTFALNGPPPSGLTFNANGTYSFDPSVAAYQALAAGQSTIITVPFTVTDNAGATSTANLVITVTGTNDTPVATADTGSLTENATLTATATTGVLANDNDPDAGDSLAVSGVSFGATTGIVGSGLAGTYGTLTLNADGSYSYATNLPAADTLAGGQVVTETFSYTVRDTAGATTTATVTFTITGTNDVPTITGPLTGTVQEDGTLVSTGTLLITDADAGQSSFVAQTATPGTYGTFAITAGGVWTYTLNNAAANVQALPGGAAPTETFTVTTADGTTRDITVTVSGTNDAAVISGATTGTVAEDLAVTAGNLTTGGTLTVTDVDSGQATFQPQASTAGAYGTFTLAANGTWTYTASNASTAIQSLGAGQSLTETFTVRSADGTTSSVVVTINGTNDVAVISAGTGSVTEDAAVVAGNITTDGTLTVTDADAGQATFQPQASTAGAYGTFTLAANGAWTYTASNSSTAIQSLGAGQTLTETFTVRSADGTTSSVVVTINGTNDVAVISAGTGSVTEDASVVAGNLTTGGTLTVADADAGQATFQPQASTAGTYGTFTLAANGAWTYTASNASTAIQSLGTGQTLTETFAVRSADGTTSSVVVTINGTNDVAVISGATNGAVTEDQAVTAGNLTTGGTLTVTDTDSGQATFQPQASTAGAYGTFTLAANGAWTYTASNSNTAIQSLGAGQTLTETFTVRSADGTTSSVVVTINGTNDVAVISAGTGSVTEDVAVTAGNISTGGTLTVTDADAGQATFQPQASTAGTYGTFTLAANGAWTYTASNSNTAIQSLGAGQTLTETFNLRSADGTTSSVVVTINGTNDVAVISAGTGSVTEDVAVTAGNLSTGGTLTVTDADAGQATFQPQASTAGTYGTFTLAANGAWTYTASNSNTAIQGLGAGQTLTETFTVRSADGTTSSVVVTINGTNDVAVISAGTGSVTEDSGVVAGNISTGGTLTVTDADSGQATFQPQASTAGTYGTFTLAANGAWTYTASNSNTAIQSLGAGQTLTETFTVRSADGTTSSVVVTINGTNDVAVISAGTGSVTEDSGVVAGNISTGGTLTVTDADSGQATFQPQASTAGTYGTFTLAANGAWTYTASNSNTAIQSLGAGQTLTETFTVRSADGTTSSVVVTINGTNDVAVISAGTGSVTEDSGVVAGSISTSGTLTVTDVDAGQATFQPQASTAGTYGTFTLAANGAWTYTASNSNTAIQSLGAGQTLTETFTVRSADGTTSSVVVTINGTNDVAVISAGTGSVTEDSGVVAGNISTGGTLTVSDADAGQATFQPQASTAGAYGTFTLAANGSWTYTASNSNTAIQSLGAGQTLTETFTVRSADGTTSSVVVTINGTNDVAVISSGTGSVTEDAAVVAGNITTGGTLTVTDADAGQATFQPQASTAGAYGTFTLAANGTWTYTASNASTAIQSLGTGQTLTETFTVRSADGTTSSVVVTINGTNDVAVISAGTGSVTEDVAVTAGNISTGGTLTVTDADSGQATFQSQASTAGTYGTFTLAANGAWTYTASNSNTAIQSLGAGQTLTETFTVRSADGTTSSVVVTINGTNDVAVISAGTGSVTEDSGVVAGNISTGGTLTVSDADAGQATFQPQASTAGAYGTFTLAANGAWTYTASNSATAIQSLGAGQSLTETFTVRSADGTTSSVVVTLNGTNDVAVISAGTGSVTEDASVVAGNLTTGGTLTVTDVDSGQATFQPQASTAGAYGTFTLAANGSWTYTASNSNTAIQSLGTGQTLTETFAVRSADGTTSSVVVTINGTNDVAVISAGTGSVTEDSAVVAGNITTGGTLTVADADAGQAAFQPQASTAGAYGTFTLAANGAWTYTASNANPAIQSLGVGQSLTDTFTVRSLDGTTSTLTVTVNGSNDAPVAQASSFTVAEDAPVVTGSVSATDIDTGSTLSFALNGAAPAGLTFNANGSYSFNPANTAYQSLGVGQQQVITVPYTVTDNAGATSTANLVITVTGTNDAPVANANTVSGSEDVALSIPVATLLANDTDVDAGTTLTITSVQNPVNGTVALVGSNVVFTPAANYSGPASFAYTVSDGQGGTSTATVTVNLAAVADAPTLLAPSQITGIVQGSGTVSTEPGVTQADLEATLGLPAGTLDGFAPPAGSTTNDPGNVNVVDGKSSNYTFELGAGNVASFNWQFFNGEDTTSEINNGFNDLVVLVITGPDGTKQYVQLTSSEQTGRNTNGAAADATGTYNFTATTAGQYQFSWLVLNGGDGGKDSSLTVAAPTVTVGGTVYGQPIDLSIGAALFDRDGSESLSAITISGVPAGAILSAGTNLGGGSWSVTTAQLADLQLLPTSGYTGSFNLTVSSTATEASNGSTATSTQTIAVTVSATTASQAGTQNADTLTGTAANDSLQGFGGNDTINAGDGNDLVYGGDGNDTIDGGNGNDWLYGGAGTDVISGGAGADRIQGGAGGDTLTGGAGADVFAWTLADRGTTAAPPTDTITDFNVATPAAGGDVLDLRDLLSGENAVNLANFIHFSTDGTSTTIQISSTGGFSGGNYGTATDQTIVLQNVNLFSGGLSTDQQIIQDLLNKSKLVVDG